MPRKTAPRSKLQAAPRPNLLRQASPPPARAARGFGEISVDTRDRGTYSHFGYHSAASARKDGRFPTHGSGDAHSTLDRESLAAQAREFGRDNGIFTGMTDRAAGYIVGTGWTPQAKSGDPEWDTLAETYFREDFWRRPDVAGLRSGPGLELEVCREVLRVGDVGILKIRGGKLQVVESEQIKGPQGLAPDGLERGADNQVVAFHVAPYGKTGAPLASRARRIQPKDFMFVTRPERPSMGRSVPPLQSSFPMLHRIKDVCDSEALAWQLLARIALVVNRTGGAGVAQALSKPDPTVASGTEEGRLSVRVTDIDTGLIFQGEPGEEVKGVDRNVPGKDFTSSIYMFVRLGGLPLGLPLEVMLLDWTKSNYSQSRAVLEQFKVSFQGWQGLLREFFYRPVYEWGISLGMKAGKIPTIPEEQAFKHDWLTPSFPWIDPEKEAAAASAKMDRSLATQAQVLKAQGMDRKEMLLERKQEILDAIAVADEIKKATGRDVPWEPLAGMATAAPQNPALPAGGKPKPKEPKEPEEGAAA